MVGERFNVCKPTHGLLIRLDLLQILIFKDIKRVVRSSIFPFSPLGYVLVIGIAHDWRPVALTLIIGGVGVANIMYAVVKERTREIGVKMALGARRGWVTIPIVLEGMMYTILGGASGLIMAVALIMLLGLLPTEGNEALELLGKPTLSLSIGIASAAILGFIGLIAGYFPARRASSINPAETLRYE